MYLIILAILALVAQLLFSLVVLLKDSKNLRNRAFFLLSLSLLAWAIVNFASEAFPDTAKTIPVIRSIMFFAVLQNCFFVLFAWSFTGKPLRLRLPVVLYFLLSIAAAAATTSPFVFSELTYTNTGELYPVVEPGMGLFVAHAAISIFLGFRMLGVQLHRTTGAWRQQMLYIFFGSLVLWGIVPLTNLIFSVALQTAFFAKFSPLYAFVFSSLIAYAVIRHHLFDIRLAIARTVMYVLISATLASMYAAAVFGFLQLFFGGETVNVAQNAVYIFTAVFLAFTFRPLHQFFSKLTNRVFFQDAYETNVVLDELSDVLVRAVAVEALTRQSLKVLAGALIPERMAVAVFDKENRGSYRVIAAPNTVVEVNEILPKLKGDSDRPLLVVEGTYHLPRSLYDAMQRAEVAVVARLETSKELIGYLFFGHKAKGSVYSPQDIDLIRIAADELAVALQNALRFQEIKEFNETLQQKVDDATYKLRETNKKLRALDEAKDEFISMASHQMRTPLTSVKGYISMILEGYGGPLKSEQRRLLSEAYNSSQRMVYLIADFLSVSRIRTGKFTLDSKPVRLTEIIQDEINQLEVTARNRGLTLVYDEPAHFPSLMLDEEKLRQVIMNLIDNAIYYTEPGGTVTIILTATAKEVSFRVQDTGIGVPKEQQHKLFGKFFRANNASRMRPDGTGIGLFLAKKIVALQGGAMIFESKPSKGSTFGFRFPRAKLEVPARAK